MRNYFAPAILQNSKLLAGAEGQLLKGFLHNHHKMPACQHHQRDGHGWSTLRGGSPQRDGQGWSTLRGGSPQRYGQGWSTLREGISPQRDGHAWSTLGGAALREMVRDGLHWEGGQPSERWSGMVYTGGGQPSERWSGMVYTGDGGRAALSLLWEGSFKKVNDPEEVRGNSAARHGFSGPLFPRKGNCLRFFGF